MLVPSPQTPRTLWFAEARRMLVLAWPLVLAQIAQVGFHTTDVVMLGWVGPDELAGISLAMALLHPLLVGGFGVVSATAPMVSQALGAGQLKSVRRTVRQGLWVAVVMSALIIPVLMASELYLPLLGQPPEAARLASAYLDYGALAVAPALGYMVFRLFISAKGNTKAVLVITAFALVVNGVLNYALIFGAFGFPELGIVGVAFATTASNLLMLVMGAVYCGVPSQIQASLRSDQVLQA